MKKQRQVFINFFIKEEQRNDAGEYSVSLKDMIEALKLENCTPDVDINDIMITQNEVNRPALQLAGYFDYFDSSRIQIIGHVEHTYMQQKAWSIVWQ